MNLHGRNSDVLDITEDGYALSESRIEPFAANAARVAQRAFTISADDADPAAGEYLLWVYNNATERRNFMVDKIATWQVAADVVWRLWEVTGTGGTAALITAKNGYLGSAISEGDLTCRGGAGGVSGLTVVGNWIDSWGGGYVYNPHIKDVMGSIIIEPGRAIAIEYDAGTTGRAGVTVYGHFYPYI
jgi:hypothetical protein